MDSWSHSNSNIDEFLKGSSQSFILNDMSYKNNESFVNNDNINPEISYDNPLDIDSHRESRQLQLEDLVTTHKYISSLS